MSGRPSARHGFDRVQHRATHLVKRFWWAISAHPMTDADRAWVGETLLPAELALFERMSRADQEHHLRVARRFVARAGGRIAGESPESPPRSWTAAALLHDSGKLVCGLGTFRRVFATLWPFGHDGDGRIGRYYRHEPIGASLLQQAGSDPVTVALVGDWPDAPPAASAALYWADDL